VKEKYFSFFDEGKLIILINGFQKKTQKTPEKEIEKAEKLKKQYFDELAESNSRKPLKKK
jgi:phage-related protein